ncbi:MAG: cytidine deaminase [Bacteroidales bacterium]|nr:cytidine deaminase [Bacteroidales bacterium]
MKQKSIVIEYDEYINNQGIQKEDIDLLDHAKGATKNSYAPYSKFNVGAAVRLSNGEIISASNQENAAYPSGLCAERVAIFYAHARYPEESVISLAVTASVNGAQCETPTYPCGACRQVLAESEQRGGHEIKIIIGGAKVTQIVKGTSSLLPFVFDNLPK